ncbi:hypothetical protein MBAV_005142 [Candidatus Magnetobacterium bavaricum]|uniref:Uncharacterized protein n=1 Tax=Candidatus Magnetobacterium bavaricum TaxID=29290 RepID=A0A0F3GL70_9BACT|nr:hypothetical protein MBAV_005142 [Candidatus Magnetobacterium bavaricum]
MPERLFIARLYAARYVAILRLWHGTCSLSCNAPLETLSAGVFFDSGGFSASGWTTTF